MPLSTSPSELRDADDATLMEELIARIEDGDVTGIDELLETSEKGNKRLDVNALCDDLTTKNPKNRPIHLAAQLGFANVTETLLRHGALPDSFNYDQRTAAHLAAHFGRVDVLKVLLKWNVDLEKQNKFANRPLHEAAFNGHQQTVAELLNAGAAVNAEGNNLCTPLHLACMSKVETSSICHLLVEYGANPLLRGKIRDYTPLHWAAFRNKDPCLAAIMGALPVQERKRVVTMQNSEGDSLLHVAVMTNSQEAANVLAYFGCDLHVRDKSGRTPLDIATDEMRQVLSSPKAPQYEWRPQSQSRDCKNVHTNAQETNRNTSVGEKRGKQYTKSTQRAIEEQFKADANPSTSNGVVETPVSKGELEDTTAPKKSDNLKEKKRNPVGSLIQQRMKAFMGSKKGAGNTSTKSDDYKMGPPNQRIAEKSNERLQRRKKCTSKGHDYRQKLQEGNVEKSSKAHQADDLADPSSKSLATLKEIDSLEAAVTAGSVHIDTARRLITIVREQQKYIQKLERKHKCVDSV